MDHVSAKLNKPILSVAHKEYVILQKDLTVREALENIRQTQFGEDAFYYFYIVNQDQQLIGIVTTRGLLSSDLDQKLSNIMTEKVIAIPEAFTILEACESFVIYKYLAFPIVNKNNHIVGVIDIKFYAEEVFDIAGNESREKIFEAIGFHILKLKDASTLKAFRFRFPWLLTTIVSGFICAILVSIYEVTLASAIILAFFITLILALGESVSMQSMTLTIQSLRYLQPTFKWYVSAFRKEFPTALMLGTACSILVGGIVFVWKGDISAAFVIGGSIILSLCMGSIIGLTVPSILHAIRMDPKISAGPLTLAFTDIFTILCYFTLAKIFLLEP